MKFAFGLTVLIAAAPACAKWREPEWGITYTSATYGNTASARDVLRREAPALGGDVLTLDQSSEQLGAGGQLVLTLRYDLLERYLTAEANYTEDMGGGAEFSQMDGNTLEFGGTAMKRDPFTGASLGVVPFGALFDIATHMYGLALIGNYPVWRGLNITGRVAMEHVRTEISANVAVGEDDDCKSLIAVAQAGGFCGRPWSHGNARNVPFLGIGLAYRWKHFGRATFEYQRSASNFGDAQTGRYSYSSLNFGLSLLLSEFRTHR